MKEEQEFAQHVDEALHSLYRALVAAADDYQFDVVFRHGAITVESKKPPAKFVVSPHPRVGQVWVSARGKSYRLDWDIVENTFTLAETGQTLKELMEEVIGQQLKEEVSL